MREAPGDPGRTDVRRVLESWRDPLRVLPETRRRHGDVVLHRFLSQRYYLVSDLEAIRHVLIENHKNYRKSSNYQGLRVLLGDGLLTSEGEEWKRQRKLAQPAFHHDRLAPLVPMMAECARDMLARWRHEHPAGRRFDLHRELMRLTFRIVGRALLSAELDGEARLFGEALGIGLAWANEHVESFVRVPLSVPTPKNLRMRRALASIDEVMARVVRERRASSAPPADLLTLLMAARDEGRGMDDRQLRDQLLTLVLAGHETTANALSFTLYLLSRHPEARRRLAEEARAVLGDRAPELRDLPALRYTTAVIEESMRLYPPAWIFEREAVADDVLGGYDVPKGSTVGISAYVVHRRPDLWPNPEGFDPERFLSDAAAARPKHAYLPFGGGPRTCIGNGFAMMEMITVLPMIVREGPLDLVPGFRLELDPAVTLRPKGGLWVARAQ